MSKMKNISLIIESLLLEIDQNISVEHLDLMIEEVYSIIIKTIEEWEE